MTLHTYIYIKNIINFSNIHHFVNRFPDKQVCGKPHLYKNIFCQCAKSSYINLIAFKRLKAIRLGGMYFLDFQYSPIDSDNGMLMGQRRQHFTTSLLFELVYNVNIKY